MQPIVLYTKKSEQQGKQAQLSNIMAAKAVADIIRTCLGPRAMLKMLMDPLGGIVMTNDGNAILREIDVAHPAAKSMLELARSQADEVGDGTTSVVIIAGEILACASQLLLDAKIHPIRVIAGFRRALDDSLRVLQDISQPVDASSDSAMAKLVASCIGTKFTAAWTDLMTGLAVKAVRIVAGLMPSTSSSTSSSSMNAAIANLTAEDIDLKQYARVERIPGGELEESTVHDGILLNKDVVHAGMRRLIEKPRILLLDCPLEYKKGESQTSLELSGQDDWSRVLQLEEEQVKAMCAAIVAAGVDLVITEKGISDLAMHYLTKANISALRRVRRTDNNRIARAVGANIVSRVEDIRTEDIGTKCGIFQVQKIGDEYFCLLGQCQQPRACSIVLRGPSKDVLAEVERNLQDAMAVVRNVLLMPRLVPGGGACEMAISCRLEQLAAACVPGIEQLPYRAVSRALEVIPRTLAQNCGADAIRTLTELRACHSAAAAAASATESHNQSSKKSYSPSAASVCYSGINGLTGKVVDMQTLGVWEPAIVKVQTLKTAIESACLLLRVDDIVSASGSSRNGGASSGHQHTGDDCCSGE